MGAAGSRPGEGRVTRARAANVRPGRSRGSARKGTSAGGEVSQIQRARLLGAAVPVVDELGWSSVTVSDIAGRARVSRRTFYDLFANREECLLAVLEDSADRIGRELVAASPDGAGWLERVRLGLWTILCSLDCDPALARVCVVQSARGSRTVLEARERILARLAGAIDEGRLQVARDAHVPAVTGEGLVGAAMAILYKRLLNGERAPLTDLHGDLMGMIVLPYLGSTAASREHKRRPPQRLIRTDGDASGPVRRREGDPLREVPMRLTYRTARVLEVVAQNPGVSNRRVGEHAGIADQGQVSKLLARLQRLGLLANTGEGHARGERNAWQLTPLGERVTRQLSLDTHLRERTA
jgi:AcrR family transcriptional regulator/DNA-binding MarR family transcriptional regulator